MNENKKSKTALLLGASGLVGGHCLRFLLEEHSSTRVIVLVRRPLPVMHEKLVQYVVDFDQLENLGNCVPVDDVYCCLGTTIKRAGSQEAFRKVDYDYTVRLAVLAQHCGATQFLLVSSLGADPHSRIFYNRVKGEVEEAIRKIPFTSCQLFRPSLLVGERKEHRPGEQAGTVLMKALRPVLIGPFMKYRSILARDVAQAMVRIAQMDLQGVNIFESQRIQETADRSGR